MYFVEIHNDLITAKGLAPALNNEQIEVSEEIYNQLTNLPATYELDTEGNIISVTPAPPPLPPPIEPTTEDYLLDLDFRLSMLELGL